MLNGPGYSRFDPSAEALPLSVPPPISALAAGQDSSQMADLTAGGVNDLVEQLGVLDDLVFEAIAGRPGAMEKLREKWPAVKLMVGPCAGRRIARAIRPSRDRRVARLHRWRRAA